MSQPTLEDARALTQWHPPLGVLSIYLGFDPADRGGAWRTELRNGLDAVLEANKDAEHGRRVALRETAKRLIERFEDGDLRPPPRGEAGFVEVGERAGAERWWGTAVAPVAGACVEYGEEPMVAPLIDLSCRSQARGIALISSERVRLLRSADGTLEDMEDWELSVTMLDWRERKSQSTNNPARAQGVSASGHDQFDERLDHNRARFLTECGGRAARALDQNGLDELLVFGPPSDVESFNAGFSSAQARLIHGGDGDLISIPTGKLTEVVADVAQRLEDERERELVERAVGEAKGGSRGALGLQETAEALTEGRVDHLVLDGAIGERAEPLVRGALAGSARVTFVHNEIATPLAEAEGVAAILRY
ncbi:MAG: VLRF1 family aeRF1-type release factor [Solirubrobacterales bacterium]